MVLIPAGIIDACIKNGFHMVALHPWSEIPLSLTWKTDAGLTRDEALTHVEAGGNLALHCAKSNLAVVAAESPDAVEAMQSMGHKPDAWTPRGAHFYFTVPEHLRGVPTHHSVVFGNLSEVLVVSGDRLVLIPPSRVPA